MGKPRMIILIRHAQSEGNKNREIHQTVPDHRVRLTPEGWSQAQEAGLRLREMLRPDDTLHFFTSPYRRTRETAEGILSSLTSNDPAPSPFPRQTIKVYEEPRLREQDFGNFQPCSAAMERMWQERADYGHFFYRIPNGESAADAYDRISGFNESLWRQFGEDGFASVCVLVTHGLMTRVFLMKWYHFSVEYFEDLRNINHCEFVVMKQNMDDGKYLLQNKLRTWSGLKRERVRELQRQKALNAEATDASADTTTAIPAVESSSVPTRRRWGGCPDGCNHSQMWGYKKKKPQRQNTQDILYEYDQWEQEEGNNTQTDREVSSQPEATIQDAGDSTNDDVAGPQYHQNLPSTKSLLSHGLALLQLGGRDGGGSQSGAASQFDSENEADHNQPEDGEKQHRHIDEDGEGEYDGDEDEHKNGYPMGLPSPGSHGQGIANSLGDRDDEEEHNDVTDRQVRGSMLQGAGGADEEVKDEADGVYETTKRDEQSIRGSVY